MIIEEILALPDSMKPAELEKYFRELLDYADRMKAAGVNSADISVALRELSDRQWHTYEPLNEGIKDRIERWIEKAWDINSEKLVKNIIVIIAELGLANSFRLLTNSLDGPMPDSVRREIIGAIAELKDNVADPYSGMKIK